MKLSDLIGINKIFSDGKLLNKSGIDFAFSVVEKSKDWQYNLTHLLKAIICEHAFLNGNKRTGAALVLYFFNKNNILYDNNLVVKAVINIAKLKKPNDKKIQSEINKCLI